MKPKTRTKFWQTFFVLFSALIMTSVQTSAQNCAECASGCAETTGVLDYGNLLCNCPTGSHCADSGGICTSCSAGGPTYCYDELNNCGGIFPGSNQTNCGCNNTCRA
jgi:hypothetical protein